MLKMKVIVSILLFPHLDAVHVVARVIQSTGRLVLTLYPDTSRHHRPYHTTPHTSHQNTPAFHINTGILIDQSRHKDKVFHWQQSQGLQPSAIPTSSVKKSLNSLTLNAYYRMMCNVHRSYHNENVIIYEVKGCHIYGPGSFKNLVKVVVGFV